MGSMLFDISVVLHSASLVLLLIIQSNHNLFQKCASVIRIKAFNLTFPAKLKEAEI